MIKFVVYGDNRTGSHFLQSLLHSHPDINCYWDLFWSKDETPLGFRNYCANAPPRGRFELFRTRNLVNGFLEDYYAKQKDVKAAGFLLKYGAADRYPAIIKWLNKHDVKVIHIIRTNHLNHEIAFALRREGTVKAHARSEVEFRPVSLDTSKLIQRMEGMQRQINKARRNIDGCAALEIRYEDLLIDLDKEIARMLSFLHVDGSAQLNSEFHKTESENPKEMLENYEDVKNALLGTRYEDYL